MVGLSPNKCVSLTVHTGTQVTHNVRFAGQRFGLVVARGPNEEHAMTEKRVWLITGAGRGLGVDIAKAALAAGHDVVATGRDAAKVAAAVGHHDNLLVALTTRS